MTRLATSIDLKGPFFQKDPRKTFRQNARVLMDALAREGQEDVRVQMRQGQAGRAPISADVRPARVADHVVGRTTSLKGRRWALTAVVSVQNSGLSESKAIALMAAASRVEAKTHAFRRTTGRIKRSRKINTAELMKGLT